MTKVKSAHDAQSKKNINTVMAIYKTMITQRNPVEAAKLYLKPDYIQHNPIIPTTADGLGKFFDGVLSARTNPKVVVHQIIAAEDYVWAHVNFLNLFNDDADDRGIAVVDIFRFDNTDGKLAEHWDTLQTIPDPKTAANTNGMF